MYLPPPNPTALTSRTHEPPRTPSPSCPTVPFHTPPLRRTYPARRTLSRAQSQPPITQFATTRPVTPPPAPTSMHRPIVQVTTNPPSPGMGLADPPSGDGATDQVRVSVEQPPRFRRPSSSSTPRLHGQPMTVIYPLLVITDMTGYFKIEDAVSHRSSKGEYRCLCLKLCY